MTRSAARRTGQSQPISSSGAGLRREGCGHAGTEVARRLTAQIDVAATLHGAEEALPSVRRGPQRDPAQFRALCRGQRLQRQATLQAGSAGRTERRNQARLCRTSLRCARKQGDARWSSVAVEHSHNG
jgi:hypothetical protein